jgi:hypothetical protein
VNFAEIRKTVAAGLVALGGGIVTAAMEGGITINEWWAIAGSSIAAVGAVWYVPND